MGWEKGNVILCYINGIKDSYDQGLKLAVANLPPENLICYLLTR